MDNILESFAVRLDKAMKLRNIKSVELHEKTGISESLISKYLSGNALARQKKIFLLSKVLDVNPAWLMGYDVPMTDLKAVKIPILINISPSIDLFSNDNIQDYTTFKIKTYWDSNIDNYFAIASPDDDMLPLLGKGDLAIIHIQDKIESGNTALVYLKDKDIYTIKKIIETKTAVELHSMNPIIKEIQTDYDNLIIIGRVIKADVESAFE
ncbi:MAG: S24 family peptidase [Clostridia bacterium]|jgi:SOS-response transcriptional repressor LexA